MTHVVRIHEALFSKIRMYSTNVTCQRGRYSAPGPRDRVVSVSSAALGVLTATNVTPPQQQQLRLRESDPRMVRQSECDSRLESTVSEIGNF